LKDLTQKYVPVKDDEIAEEVVFGGKSVILCLSH